MITVKRKKPSQMTTFKKPINADTSIVFRKTDGLEVFCFFFLLFLEVC